jgi:Flp pilus assembly protein TadG
VLINFFLFVSVLFLLSGLALDAGMLELRKLQLQHAADAAALGAIYEKARGNAGWAAAGAADAALNGFTNGVNGVTVSVVSPPTSGAYAGNAANIQATVTQSYHTAFMGLITGGATASPGTLSVAAGSYYSDCVYIMGPGSSYFTLAVDGNSGFYSGCNIYVNSTSLAVLNNYGSTLQATGGSSIKLHSPTTAGNLFWGTTSPSATYNVLSQSDPFAYETAPVFSSCPQHPTPTNISSASGTVTLNPGTYCGGININASTVNFNQGLYIVTGGMTWQNGSTITSSGNGVTFFLTTGGGYSYGNFNINNSTVTLSAPTSTAYGGITGIVVFGDRNWSNQGNQGVSISASYVTTDGIWYVLNTGIYNANSTLRGTSYLGLVVDNIKTTGATFTIPTPNYSTLTGGSPFEGSTYGSLVQ